MAYDSPNTHAAQAPEKGVEKPEKRREIRVMASLAEFLSQSAGQHLTGEALEDRLLMSLSFALRRRTFGN